MKTEVEKLRSHRGVRTIQELSARMFAMLKELINIQRIHEIIAGQMFR